MNSGSCSQMLWSWKWPIGIKDCMFGLKERVFELRIACLSKNIEPLNQNMKVRSEEMSF